MQNFSFNQNMKENSLEQNTIRVPHKIKRGDEISLVTPGGLPPERFLPQVQNSKDYLVELGFIINDLTLNKEDIDEAKKSMRNSFTRNTTATLPVSGGKFSLEVAHDLEVPSQYSGIFCGFSNLYPFVLKNYTKGLVSFYGQHIGFINTKAPQRESAFNIKNYWTTLTKDNAFVSKYGLSSFEQRNIAHVKGDELIIPNPYLHLADNISPYKNDAFYYNPSEATHIAGESFIIQLELVDQLEEPMKGINYENKILLIDSFNSSLEEKMLSINKIFSTITRDSKVAGILFSSFTDTRYIHNFKRDDIENFLHKVAELSKCPVAYGFPFGHSRYKTPIPVGVHLEADLVTGTLTFKKYLAD